MKRSLSLLSLSLVLALNGCASWFGKESWSSEEDEFLASRLDKPLALPADIPSAVQEDEFPVPGLATAVAEAPRGAALDIVPPKLVLSVGRDVLIDTSGKAPVLTFNMSPATLFERTQKFLSERDIPVRSADPASGIILTDWVEHDQSGFFDLLMGGDDSLREQFKLSVTQDGNSGKGSLTVEQLAREVDTGEGWQATATNATASTEMLNRYLGWYDDAEQRAARSRVLAEKAGFAVRLGKNSSDVPAFVADAPFQRVWERMPGVLEPLGFVFEDKDQSLGAYFVQYDGPPDQGFLDSLAIWRKGSDVPELDLEQDDYQFKLEELDDAHTAIMVLDDDDKPLSAEKLQKIEANLAQAFEARVSDMPALKSGEPRPDEPRP